MVIYPYWNNGTWVFDDKQRGLKKEAFVMGADDILTEALVLRGIGLRETKDGLGFKCTFSDEPLEGGFEALLLGPRDLEYEYEVPLDWVWADDIMDDLPEMGAKEMKDAKDEKEQEEKEQFEALNPAWLPMCMPTQNVVAGMKGNDYVVQETGSIGWLCPALLKFYDEPPQKLYFAVERIDLDEEIEG